MGFEKILLGICLFLGTLVLANEDTSIERGKTYRYVLEVYSEQKATRSNEVYVVIP